MPQEPKEKMSQSWRKTQKKNCQVKALHEPTGQKGNSFSSSLKMGALIYQKNLDNAVSDANGNIITPQESTTGQLDTSVPGTNSDVVKVVPDNVVSTKTATTTCRDHDNNKTTPTAVQQARSRSRSTVSSGGCDSGRNVPESSSGKKFLAKRSQSVPRIDFRNREPPADKRWNSSNRYYSHNNMEQIIQKPAQKTWSRRLSSGSFDGRQILMPPANANHWSRAGVRTTAPQSFNTSDGFDHERFRHRVDLASKRYQFYEHSADRAQRGNHRRWSTVAYDAQLTVKNTRQSDAFDQARLSHPADTYHRAATDRLSHSHVTSTAPSVGQPQQYSDNSKTTASKKQSVGDNTPKVLTTSVKLVNRTPASTRQRHTTTRLHSSLEHAAPAVENSVPPMQYPAPRQYQPTPEVLQEFPIDLSRSAMTTEPTNTKMIPSLPSYANSSASQNPDKNRTPDANVFSCANYLDIKLLKNHSTNDTVKLTTRLSSDAVDVTHPDTNLFTKNEINCAPNRIPAPDEPTRTRSTARSLDFCPRIDTSVPPPSHPQRANQTIVPKPRVTTQPIHMNTIRQDIKEEMARARSMSIPVNFNPDTQDKDQSRLNPSADEFSPTLKDAYGNSYTVSSSKGVFYFRPQVELASNPKYVVATEPQFNTTQSMVGHVYNSGVVNIPYTMGVISQQPVSSYPTADLQKPAYYMYDEHGQLSATLLTPGPQVSTTASYTPMLGPSVGPESLVFTFPQAIVSQNQVYQFPVQSVPQFCSTNPEYTTQTNPGVSSFTGYQQPCLTTQCFSYEPQVIQNSALLHNTQLEQHTPLIQLTPNLPLSNANYAVSFPEQSMSIPVSELYQKINTENSPTSPWSHPSPLISNPSQESPPQASNITSRSTYPQSQTAHAHTPQTPPEANQKASDENSDVTKSVAERLVQFFKTGSMEKLRSNGGAPGALPADLDIVETLIDLIRVLQSRNPSLTDRDLVDIVHVHLQMFYMGAQSGSDEEKCSRRRCNM